MFNASQKFLFPVSFKRHCATNHLVEENPDRPKIAFKTVNEVLYCLRTHVQGSPNIVLNRFNWVTELWEPEIRKFRNAFVEQDVCRLDVPMDYVLRLQFLQSVQQVSKNLDSIVLAYFLALVKQTLQITLGTVFRYQVGIVRCGVVIVKLDNVGRFEHLETVDFILQKLFFNFICYELHVNYLNGH